MKITRDILSIIGWILPIGYALYVREWQPLLLVLFFWIGAIVGIITTLRHKE
jgi:hypothetical protein